MKQFLQRSVRTLFAVLGFGAAALVATPASAGVVWFPPITGFEDDDLAWVLKRNPDGTFTQYTVGGGGTLEVGDRIRGVIEFNNSFSVLPSGFQSPILGGLELTGIYDLTIAAKVPTGLGTFNYFFEPTLGQFGNAVAGQGVFIRMWLGPANLDTIAVNCATLAACEGLASDGAHWADLGFNGDVNERFVVTNMLDTIDALANAAASTAVGNEQFFLNVLVNNTGQVIVPQTCTPFCPAGGDNAIDVIGSGTLLGGQGLTNGAVARSDVQAQVTTAVPEPGTLALLAGGLIALGLRRRIIR